MYTSYQLLSVNINFSETRQSHIEQSPIRRNNLKIIYFPNTHRTTANRLKLTYSIKNSTPRNYTTYFDCH